MVRGAKVRWSLMLLLLVPLVLSAQGRAPSSQFRQAVEYDGNLTFTRLIYGSGLRGFGFRLFLDASRLGLRWARPDLEGAGRGSLDRRRSGPQLSPISE